MKNHRIFALATSVLAITLAGMPSSAAAATRKAGGSNLIYVQYATAAPTSSAETVMEVVAMAADNFLWFPTRA
ncbi:MAG: hypothetical protein ABSA94_02905 [Acidobacteriaceae bacterium]|jgi:hypothetical protein